MARAPANPLRGLARQAIEKATLKRTHPYNDCPNRFFTVEERFNGGCPYTYLSCGECGMAWLEDLRPPYEESRRQHATRQKMQRFDT